jgi:hypothetical protein
MPNISRLRFWGSRTLMISSPGGDPGLLSVSTTSPLIFHGDFVKSGAQFLV